MQAANDMGAIVRFHRKKGGLTQAGLARMAGVGKTSVFDLENGKASLRLNTIQSILSVLNIQLEMKSPLMAEFQRLKDAPARK